MDIKLKDGLLIPSSLQWHVDEVKGELHINAAKGTMKHYAKRAISEAEGKFAGNNLKPIYHDQQH